MAEGTTSQQTKSGAVDDRLQVGDILESSEGTPRAPKKVYWLVTKVTSVDFTVENLSQKAKPDTWLREDDYFTYSKRTYNQVAPRKPRSLDLTDAEAVAVRAFITAYRKAN